ncbi:LPS-assembly protein LptD [Xenophilus arseniciresistens]|uniref:LPS-assembly protein LptD n=1 Tax=Xenophilus arseniciresistens TaxID=1283306 RepID=A0AAE3NGF5_9BURK|nr:LPS-assembly protein LptD [Xenophilus arseniciresistens]MDA7419219.1 LPS-assembly protein LptD [Xenophilus arseniciresistens]
MPELTRANRPWWLPPVPLALLSMALLQAQAAWAQSAWEAETPLKLQRTPMLLEAIPADQRGGRPSIVEGDRISGRPNLETIVEGNAELRRADTVIRADRLEYYQPDDLAKATGNVRVNRAGNVYEGPALQLKVERFEGFFNDVRYQLLATGAHGKAERVDFIDADRAVARRATYTTCRRDDTESYTPAWFLSAESLRTDSEENVGVAENVQLHVFGVPTPPIPRVSFPLNNERKSGLLPPTMGIDSLNGLELALPYYWNIAPNRDATLTTTVMAKRGVNVSGEFRYLEPAYNGEVRLDYMPSDSLPSNRRDEAISLALGNGDYARAAQLAAESSRHSRGRWGLWTKHHHSFNARDLGLDSLSADLQINRVSDDDYWRDFDRTPTRVTRLLPNDASLNWSKGDWSGRVRALKYQTLQNEDLRILPPYDRLPQLTADYTRYDWRGFDFSLNTDFTRFRANTAEQGQPNADRAVAKLQLSRPFLWPGAYVTPKVQLHTASYSFSSPLADGRSSATSTVPTFSVDSGMTFERDTSLFGKAYRQTLEPRAMYVYTPYRAQNRLPVYDTAANDFSFATLFTENEFSGSDRVSSTHSLTVGLSSRFLDAETGAERARVGIAQRRRFADQRITLPNTVAVTDRASDLLLGAQVNISPKWSVDTTVQYNPDDRRSNRSTVTARYTPGPYRTLSASYRYQADRISTNGVGNESIDLGWQWPLNDLWGDKGKDLGPGRGQGGGRWYALGRLNYSLRDKLMTDAVVGVEYDGCCYIGRVVFEKVSTGVATSTKRIMFQIEFLGFTSIGASPMQTLQLNVPRYQPLRLPQLAPSRFSNYD